MTLEDFSEKVFSIGLDFTTAYIFDDSDYWDQFCTGNRNVEILFTLCSANRTSVYLKEKWCKALIYGFVPVDKGVIAVLIDADSGKKSEHET